ncbi:MAG TPA: Fic family protein [Thermoplasmata archaeon]|nr:Fic family protein [Thermoplasmata archaeon]
MGTVRTVRRGSRTYRYLVQSYRWNGVVRKKQLYLGTSLPTDLTSSQLALERAIWKETWFAQFDAIQMAFQKRLARLPPSVHEKESEDFALEFTYDTNRIEGSTLSLEDTRRLLERGITPAARPLNDILETQKHATIVRRLIHNPEPITLSRLLGWHKELFSETKPDIAGRLRDFEVRIRGSQHVPPSALEVRPMLLELIRWSTRASTKIHPVELSAEFHFRFEHIHPFGDGNGRIGRLAMNSLLAQRDFPMLNILYARRRGYYRALELSSLRGDARPFLRWFFLRYSRDMQFYLRR